MDLQPTALQVTCALVIAAFTLAAISAVAEAAGSRFRLILLTAAILSGGAAVIHFAVIEAHFKEWWGYGAFFVASGVAQLAWSLLIVRWPSQPLFWLGVLGNAAIVGLWLVTRTKGTLFGPGADEPEPVGVADSISTGFELAIVLVGLTTVAFALPKAELLRKVAWGVAIMTVGLTAIGLLSAIGAAPGVIPPAE